MIESLYSVQILILTYNTNTDAKPMWPQPATNPRNYTILAIPTATLFVSLVTRETLKVFVAPFYPLSTPFNV